MSVVNAGPIRDVLRAAVIRAMKERDRPALSVYRSALAAIDNAEAVPLRDVDRAGAIESSVTGAGHTDVARRVLTEQDMIDVVRREITELHTSAESLAGTDSAAEQRLRSAAGLLQALLDGIGHPDGARIGPPETS